MQAFNNSQALEIIKGRIRDHPAFLCTFLIVIVDIRDCIGLKSSRCNRQPFKGKTGPILKSGSKCQKQVSFLCTTVRINHLSVYRDDLQQSLSSLLHCFLHNKSHRLIKGFLMVLRRVPPSSPFVHIHQSICL